MSCDIGGAVRAGAGAMLRTGATVGAGVAAGTAASVTTIVGTGVVQSSGCTMASPVLSS